MLFIEINKLFFAYLFDKLTLKIDKVEDEDLTSIILN